TSWKFWRRRRHVVALLAFLGFFNVYSLRVNLSVAIVAMNSPYNVTADNGTTYETKDFDWDSKTQGLVLSSFFYGYICTQLLGGWLGARVGGARVYGAGVAVTAVLTLVTPPVGVTYPCIHAVWSVWAPPPERSTIATFAFSGSYFGTVASLPISGLLANYFGWESIFYVTGSVGVIWSIAWWIIVKDRPEDDPKISASELKYLRESLGKTPNTKIVHPWKEFLKSLPVWAIVCAHFCENWGFYTLLTQLPTFMKDTMNFDLGKAGFLSSLPYLVMTIIMQFGGRLADFLINKKILSTTNVRKSFNCGAFLAQTVFMIMAAYLLTPTAVIVCLTLAVGLGAFAWPGFSVNHLDIAPQHASVLMGFSNTFATLPGMISPLITGYIVTNKSGEEWKLVFYIAGVIYLVGAIFYGTFASAERQPWAKDTVTTKPDDQETTNGNIIIERF
ncbi:hypothetical protein AAG570_011558, partial [Ranatra chinensis]